MNESETANEITLRLFRRKAEELKRKATEVTNSKDDPVVNTHSRYTESGIHLCADLLSDYLEKILE